MSVSNPLTRFFKCIYNDETFGRFSCNKPKQGAEKAFTAIIKNYKNNNICNKPITFQIVEVTRDQPRKIFTYIGIRKELEKPVEISIGDKTIMYKYYNSISRDKSILDNNSESDIDGDLINDKDFNSETETENPKVFI